MHSSTSACWNISTLGRDLGEPLNFPSSNRHHLRKNDTVMRSILKAIVLEIGPADLRFVLVSDIYRESALDNILYFQAKYRALYIAEIGLATSKSFVI